MDVDALIAAALEVVKPTDPRPIHQPDGSLRPPQFSEEVLASLLRRNTIDLPSMTPDQLQGVVAHLVERLPKMRQWLASELGSEANRDRLRGILASVRVPKSRHN